MNKEYDYVFSIGSNCATALHLQRNNLRKQAGPLDWIVSNQNFSERIDFIVNDFPEMLVLDRIEEFDCKDGKPSDHNRYCVDKKSGIYFMHDFPKNKSIAESFESVKDKYARRIARFKKNIEQGHRVLLVWMSATIFTEDSDILEAEKKLHARFGKNIDLLFIEHTTDKSKICQYNLSPSVIRYYADFERKHENGMPDTMGDLTVLDPIYATIKLPSATNQKIRSFSRRYITYPFVYLGTTLAYPFIRDRVTKRKLRHFRRDYPKGNCMLDI